MPISIDIVSDVVCPWCFVGKRRLEAALALYRKERPRAEPPQVTWHPFQLNPDLPEEGIQREQYLKRKFGAERAQQIYARIAAVGAEVGIAFAFERIRRQPNTLAAHSLIALAGHHGCQEPVVEAFFRAYFLEGRDLSSRATLVEIGTGAGLDPAQTQAFLASAEARRYVQEQDRQARELGITGVPFFIFNRRLAVSGAQHEETLLAAMLEAEPSDDAASG